MFDVKILISTMLELFALIMVGFYLGKKGKINKGQNNNLSYLAANVFCPAMVIGSIFSKGGVSQDSIVLEALYVGLLFYVFLFLFTVLIFKFIKVQSDNIYKMSFIFYNTGFIGYPVIQALYGDYAIFVFSILHLGYNFFIFSYGVMLVQGKSSFHIKDMLTPGFISSIIALIIYFGNISFPDAVVDCFTTLGNATVPVSMLVIGVSLSFVPIRQSLKNKTMFIMVLLKLVGMPILIAFLLRFIPISETMSQYLIISTTLPAGSMIVILANQYKVNTDIAASLVFVSTFLSIITIPIMLNLLL